MATINRTPESEKQKFQQIDSGGWSNIYLPAISAGVVMTVVLFMAVSCSKKSGNPEAKISAPPEAAVEIPAIARTGAMLPETPKKAVKKHRPAVATYVNGTYGVSFSYPRKYSLAAGGKQIEMPVESGFVKPGAVEIASVDMPDGGYPGTDFSSALLNVSVNKGLSQEECAEFAGTPKDESAKIDAGNRNQSEGTGNTTGSTPPKLAEEAEPPTSIKLGLNEFTETEQMKPAGERQSDVKYFHVFRNDACYEFALDVETSRKAEVDLAQVDRDQVFKQLAKILTTAKIKEIELPGMDKAERPSAAAQSQPDSSGEPAPSAGPPAGSDNRPLAQSVEK
ncbi:MAG: hypothetical protein J2P13_12790, partial [Acidobacteria bacterium]|nr:hypothetical protein [Acidobacteriota bacterium]